MKSGFVNIFGKPNAGKSTLLNAITGTKLAIVSHKAQTTRNRIKAFLNKEGEYQIILSDTPGIIEKCNYKLHGKMMEAVKSSLEDADVALLLVDVNDDTESNDAMFDALKLTVPSIIVINKIDKVKQAALDKQIAHYQSMPYCTMVHAISALQNNQIDNLLNSIISLLPEAEPFYNTEDLSDLPTKFFVGEIIREKVFLLLEEEIPYQAAVVVNEYKEKDTLVKIQADIIVSRDSQKNIVIGEKGGMIKQIGSQARVEIESFIERKVFLELFVKVKPKWRDTDFLLKELGY